MKHANVLGLSMFLAALGGVGCSGPDAAADGVQATSDSLTDDKAGDSGPSNGSCSDAQGELLYTASRYEGGAAPPPWLVVSERKLVYKGDVVGHTQTRASGESEDLHTWAVRLRFETGSKQILARSGNDAAGSETFVQKVVGTFVMGLGPSIEANTITKLVICQDHWNYLLP
jgi:hypothetical protein